MSTYVLVLGYILAVPPLVLIIFRFRYATSQWWIMAAEWLGTALIIVGWVMLDSPQVVFINASWLVIFTIIWLWTIYRGTIKVK